MYLTFPTFCITCPIPADADLCLDIEHLMEDGWCIPMHMCNGVEDNNSDLDDFFKNLYF